MSSIIAIIEQRLNEVERQYDTFSVILPNVMTQKSKTYGGRDGTIRSLRKPQEHSNGYDGKA
ncbi:3112_t:CDS:2 [Diversispora eburnea]|uniref:3112_t:CDS:1 n=1 Tax=Diversispora eburnea TaxID=1213867 RepID=A0A9N9A0T8_9GLOM|nr:3112_t:CDS:2 [Diversispora eburnea]